MNGSRFNEIFHPERQAVRVGESLSAGRIPWPIWILLTAVAVCGSCLFGASIPGFELARSAAWITSSAGLAWCVFGPTLWWFTRLPLLLIAHTCMVAMAYGEGVLALGAIGNFLTPLSGTTWSCISVLVSNVTMAWVLATQLRAFGVPVRRTLILWNLVLNGLGSVLFWLLYRFLLRGNI